MLRAIRFEQRFKFRIEDRTLELINGAIPLLVRVSGDRIRHELDRILEENLASMMLARLDDLNLLRTIQRDLMWDEWISERIKSLAGIEPEPDWCLELTGAKLRSHLGYILWLIRLPAIPTRKVIKRLKLPRTLADEIHSAQDLWHDISSLKVAKPSKIVTRLDEILPLAVYANYLATQDEQVRKFIWEYVSNWRQVIPQTDGHILRQLGLPPGPIYRQILRTLRNAWLDGKIVSPEEEESLLEKLLPKG
jgi:tRNA nucleotidyltransferase (CCA-adding enzyme)